ncbi:MAG: 4Fe-4S binding protein [Candidatus Latescibacteria bacterium]|nr:4Fe-4S binding protein [Candidatus Latescibacterota bacterium]
MYKKYPKPVECKSQSGIEIIIIKEFCKGCGICVEFCPKNVLALGSDFKVNVANIDACNGDKLCELRCPDYAIFIKKQKKSKES